jgi:hypothetical protein
MLKNSFKIVIMILCLALLLTGIFQMRDDFSFSSDNSIRVVIAYNPKNIETSSGNIAGFESVLDEEGIPHARLDQYSLLNTDPSQLVKTVPVIILPDGACKIMNSSFEPWFKRYLESGGSLMLTYDSGVQSLKGAYLPNSFFSKLAGVQHIHYHASGEKSYTSGVLQFIDKISASKCQIPMGKLDENNILSGYGYGNLNYPAARSKIIPNSGTEVYANMVTPDGEKFPAITVREIGKGNLMYVNLPLGYLKSHGDDLLLRSLCRTLIFDYAAVPHLLNTPGGIGGLVINWHHDSNEDLRFMEQMEELHILRDGLQYSMHISAGDSRDEKGDMLGFDACGTGKEHVQIMMKYGQIGTHGGMYHNWFAWSIEDGTLDESGINYYITENSNCLTSVTGKLVTEYSAPNGVHPQPIMTEILESQNIVAYYNTGDSGSAPNRFFQNGKMLSDKIIGFPVMPFGNVASMGEMDSAGYSSEDVHEWLLETSSYCAKNRTVRMIYSHPYDLFEYENSEQYIDPMINWLDTLEKMQRAGRLHIKPMTYFAQFLLKMLETDYSFTIEDDGLAVSLQNDAGLDEISFTISSEKWLKPESKDISVNTISDQHYITIISDKTILELTCKNREK